MPLEINIQFNIVLYSLIAGILTGVLFDIYRIVRGANVIKVLVIIEDVLFWILSSLVVFTFLLYFNYAFLGPYVYIFLLISFLFYYKVISPKVVSVEQVIGRGTSKSIRITCKATMYPFKIIWSKFGNKSK
ncbi:MAG: spore cortex biosynthesis protein YabQ [Clostridium sp.]